MLLLQETIYTDRLVLRPFTLTDAPQVKALAGDRKIYETTLFVPYPYDDGMAESWISTHQAGFYEGRGVVFAICLASGALIGAISLNRRVCSMLQSWVTGLGSRTGTVVIVPRRRKPYWNTVLIF